MGVWGWIAVVLVVIVGILVALYFAGKKLQKKQAETQTQLDAMKQYVSLLVIDKKLMKPAESGLPEVALSQLPWYAKKAKLPIVKAKIGPQIMSLIADTKVFEIIPVKKECKVALSGIYITELKSVRGGKIPEKPAKQSFFKKLFSKKDKQSK